VRLGSLPLSGTGWHLTTAVNNNTGQIGVELFSNTPILTTAGGSLVTVSMEVRNQAPAGTTALSLVSQVTPTGQRAFETMVTDAQGAFVLHVAATPAVAIQSEVPNPMPHVRSSKSEIPNGIVEFGSWLMAFPTTDTGHWTWDIGARTLDMGHQGSDMVELEQTAPDGLLAAAAGPPDWGCHSNDDEASSDLDAIVSRPEKSRFD